MNASHPAPSGRLIHETNYSVPFHLADPVGVLFFGNIYAAAHSVLEEWAREKGAWNAWFATPEGVGYPIRHSEADYFRFMKHGDTFRVALRCLSVSDSTVKFETEFSKEGFVHARVLTVHTAIDITTHKKSVIPAPVRRFFE